MKIHRLAAVAVGATALAASAPAAAANRLIGTVGPRDTITLRTASGARVTTLKAGAYVIVVRDRAADHNFILRGPGVSKATGVGSTGTVTWRVRLRGGTYRYVCAPHADDMRGTFRVR